LKTKEINLSMYVALLGRPAGKYSIQGFF